jgi:FkbH-like protein
MRKDEEAYRVPRDLWITPTSLNRVLVLGSCLLRGWPHTITASPPRCPCDFVLINNTCALPDQPPRSPAEYNFQVVQLPLRSVVPDRAYFRLNFDDAAAYERVFLESKVRLATALANAMRWNAEHGMLTFVFNFPVPQVNPMGRLLPRYDLRNMMFFIERLNEALAHELGQYDNSFLFDFDQILATFGRKYFLDDAVWQTNHGSALEDSNVERDGERLEAVGRIGSYFPLNVKQYQRAAWNELVGMYRTVLRVDTVKLIVVDLDDTLWRGVAAERSDYGPDDVEGWPLGLVEALGYLKRRGLLLALLSKGDANYVAKRWEQTIHSRRLSLDDFAIRKVNWQPKSVNLTEILRETNLLPGNTVVIDDSPVERASLTRALPGLRAFGSNPYQWRRILLWSAETQVAAVTSESARRTETVKSKIRRDHLGAKLSRDAFLAELRLQIRCSTIRSAAVPGFARALELVNKTNQFNTTGRRWTEQECRAAFDDGTSFCAFDVKDKFIRYGMACVAIVRATTILQFALSCRVIGMDVESAALAAILRALNERGATTVTAQFAATQFNLLCRDFYRRCGFTRSGNGYRRRLRPALEVPTHIRVRGRFSIGALN